MAKEEAKAEAKGEAAAASAAKPPMFSKTGLIVLVVMCAACAAVPAVLLKGKGDAPAKEGKEHGKEASGHESKGFMPPKVCNSVELDEISMPYRESGAGGPRRSFKVTVVLKLVTNVMLQEPEGGGGEHEAEPKIPEGKEKEAKEDRERLKAAQKLKPEIYDKISNIFRGRSPDDFATNELIDQTRQQIRRTLNDEIFGQQEVVQAVLFTKSQF